jgi:hypothetical protein
MGGRDDRSSMDVHPEVSSHGSSSASARTPDSVRIDAAKRNGGAGVGTHTQCRGDRGHPGMGSTPRIRDNPIVGRCPSVAPIPIAITHRLAAPIRAPRFEISAPCNDPADRRTGDFPTNRAKNEGRNSFFPTSLSQYRRIGPHLPSVNLRRSACPLVQNPFERSLRSTLRSLLGAPRERSSPPGGLRRHPHGDT